MARLEKKRRVEKDKGNSTKERCKCGSNSHRWTTHQDCPLRRQKGPSPPILIPTTTQHQPGPPPPIIPTTTQHQPGPPPPILIPTTQHQPGPPPPILIPMTTQHGPPRAVAETP